MYTSTHEIGNGIVDKNIECLFTLCIPGWWGVDVIGIRCGEAGRYGGRVDSVSVSNVPGADWELNNDEQCGWVHN